MFDKILKMETVKLNIEVKADQLDLVKSLLKNIKGILNVEEENDEHLESFLKMEKDYFDGNLETISEENFRKSAKDKLCKLYSQK